MMKIRFTVLVPAYNEEANIANLLASIVKQKLLVGQLEKIVVVASGCTDETERIVGEWIKRDKRIKLLRQRRRQGKAAAINYFLSRDKSRIVVMTGGDVVLERGCLEALVKQFLDVEVGMVGARIRSVNKAETFLGWANKMIWRLHDQMARDNPRLGEITAWRRVFKQLPKETICDEAEIEMLVRAKDLRLVYEPEAVGYNRGPVKWREYLGRRRSIHVGHMMIKKRWGRVVESERPGLLLKYLIKEMKIDKRRKSWYLGLVLVEVWVKLLAMVDYCSGKKEMVWPIAKSAKKEIKIK